MPHFRIVSLSYSENLFIRNQQQENFLPENSYSDDTFYCLLSGGCLLPQNEYLISTLLLFYYPFVVCFPRKPEISVVFETGVHSPGIKLMLNVSAG